MNFLSSLHQMVADASSSLQVNTALLNYFSIKLAIVFAYYQKPSWLLLRARKLTSQGLQLGRGEEEQEEQQGPGQGR